MRDLRNALEHRYLKLSTELGWTPRNRPEETSSEVLDALDDNLALLRNRLDFEKKALRMLKTVRAAMIYLCLAVHWEERRRAQGRDPNQFVPWMEAFILEDEWKF